MAHSARSCIQSPGILLLQIYYSKEETETMTESYYEQFDYKSELIKQIRELEERIKIQQEGVNAATTIIDDLRKENTLLKKNLYLRELTNEIIKYKNLYHKAQEDYIRLSERYNELMSKYIKL